MTSQPSTGKTHAYLRVSTDTQDGAGQRNTIENWASASAITVDAFHVDTVSGKVPWQERALGPLLAACTEGDRIIVSEISRIARSTVGVLHFFEAAAERGVEVVAIAQRITLDKSLGGMIARTIFAMVAEIERVQLSERTKAALAARRAAGATLGRPRGSRSACKLDKHAADIKALQDARVSKRAIARVMGVAPSTYYAYLARIAGTDLDPATLPLFPQPETPDHAR